MHTWCRPSRLEYGSRALSRLAKQLRAELFFQFSIFARETNVGSEIQDIHKGVKYKWVTRWIFFFTRWMWSCFVLQNTLCDSIHIQTSETPVVIEDHRTRGKTRSIQVILEKKIDYVITLCWSVWFCMYWYCVLYVLFVPSSYRRAASGMHASHETNRFQNINCCAPRSDLLSTRFAHSGGQNSQETRGIHENGTCVEFCGDKGNTFVNRNVGYYGT